MDQKQGASQIVGSRIHRFQQVAGGGSLTDHFTVIPKVKGRLRLSLLASAGTNNPSETVVVNAR
jgi:hypothetical protein